jgi:trans-2,3-dihydro-3-hydroxyanthranilate isomerase
MEAVCPIAVITNLRRRQRDVKFTHTLRRLIGMKKELRYSILDVFAERPLEGNPLAVFHDARSLSDAEMQALARETNLSETTFVLPEEDEREGVRVRIFTAREELPFAGHPTLGTASWLHLHHPLLRGAEEMTLRLNAGPVPVRFAHDDGNGVVATMQQSDPLFGELHDAQEIARVIGMNPADLLPGVVPQTVSTGNPFCIVALRSVEALQRLAIPEKESAVWLQQHKTRWFYCIAPLQAKADREAPRWRARMQFNGGEDPATGSAAGCCIAWLVNVGLATPDAPVTIEQGIEMGRPSRIVTVASLRDGGVHSVRVSGRTIPVAEGRFFLS